MGTTDKLAAFVVGLQYEQIPAAALALLKRQCSDTIGVGLHSTRWLRCKIGGKLCEMREYLWLAS